MMCSDKLGYIRQPVLSLQLDLSRGGQPERVAFEMSKEELRKMISSLEAANKVRTSHLIYVTRSAKITHGVTLKPPTLLYLSL